MRAFSRTSSGFDIAKLDLKFRKSGDILDGTIQSGVKFRWSIWWRMSYYRKRLRADLEKGDILENFPILTNF